MERKHVKICGGLVCVSIGLCQLSTLSPCVFSLLANELIKHVHAGVGLVYAVCI